MIKTVGHIVTRGINKPMFLTKQEAINYYKSFSYEEL